MLPQARNTNESVDQAINEEMNQMREHDFESRVMLILQKKLEERIRKKNEKQDLIDNLTIDEFFDKLLGVIKALENIRKTLEEVFQEEEEIFDSLPS